MIDKYTDAHIIICKILEDPNNFRYARGQYDTKETYRELISKKLDTVDKSIINIIVKELYDNGLIKINTQVLDERPSFMNEGAPQLTDLGQQFFRFIQKPDFNL
jgi:hypothetical protein